VAYGDTGDPNKGASYDQDQNTLTISTSAGDFNSWIFRQYVVHECTHAIQDALEVTTTIAIAEAIAYVAGALYIIYNGERGNVPSLNDGPYKSAFAAADYLAQATAVDVPDNVMQPVIDAVVSNYGWTTRFGNFIANGLMPRGAPDR
jgi:hypothetical protein